VPTSSFRCALNQLAVIASLTRQDLGTGIHKYAAHKLALLYQAVNLSKLRRDELRKRIEEHFEDVKARTSFLRRPPNYTTPYNSTQTAPDFCPRTRFKIRRDELRRRIEEHFEDVKARRTDMRTRAHTQSSFHPISPPTPSPPPRLRPTSSPLFCHPTSSIGSRASVTTSSATCTRCRLRSRKSCCRRCGFCMARRRTQLAADHIATCTRCRPPAAEAVAGATVSAWLDAVHSWATFTAGATHAARLGAGWRGCKYGMA
jgi:hypothetical protein